MKRARGAAREAEARQVRIEEQERAIARLETLAQVRLSGPQGAG